MTERPEQSLRPLPMTMFDGDKVQQEIQQTNRLILPKGTRALLLLSLPDFSLGNPNTANFGAITLAEDFMGSPRQGFISEAYYGLPKTAVRIDVLPDSDERRDYMQKRKTVYESKAYKKQAEELKQYNRGYLVNKGLAQDEPYHNEIAAIDKQLAAEFLADRQDDLEFYNIDLNQVKRIRLQVAVDKKIKTTF